MLSTFLVVDLISIPDPSNLPSLILGHGEDSRFHTVLKQWEFLGHIDNIEFDVIPFRHISDTEEEPLIITLSIDIILQDKVIFIELFLVYFIEISWLKIGIEFD